LIVEETSLSITDETSSIIDLETIIFDELTTDEVTTDIETTDLSSDYETILDTTSSNLNEDTSDNLETTSFEQQTTNTDENSLPTELGEELSTITVRSSIDFAETTYLNGLEETSLVSIDTTDSTDSTDFSTTTTMASNTTTASPDTSDSTLLYVLIPVVSFVAVSSTLAFVHILMNRYCCFSSAEVAPKILKRSVENGAEIIELY
jgi:hypothetical protein